METIDAFEFSGLSTFIQKLALCMTDVAYVTIADYRSRLQLYRIALDANVLTQWLSQSLAHSDDVPQIQDRDSLLAAVELWVKSATTSGMSATMRQEFMVQAVAPKGGNRVVSCKVVASGLELEDSFDNSAVAETPVPAPSQQSPKLVMMKPDLSEADSTEISKNFRNVGEQYTHVTHLALSTASELKEMLQDQIKDQREANQQLRQENSELRQENRNMLGRLEEQVHAQREQTNTSNEQVYGLAKLQVANNAVAQVAGTLQQFLALKAGAGLPPQLQVLLKAINRSPILMGSLNDPDVQTLLQDDEVLNQLGHQLREFASMKKLAAAQPVPS